MVERWNIGFQKDIRHFNFIVNPVNGGTAILGERVIGGKIA
jgi:hypothetical protein